MSDSLLTQQIEILMILMLVASATAILVKQIKLPYSIALVIVGLLIGSVGLFPQNQMTPGLILLVFLPALLFEASWNLDWKLLVRNVVPIGVLATVGVVLTMLIIGTIVHWAGLPWIAALALGALLSATDPISVLALFRQLGIDERLSNLIEGESLINDGTAVVLFEMVIATDRPVGYVLPLVLIGKFVLMVAGGAIVGTAVGFIASRVTRRIDDHLLELMLTNIVAYGSFLLAKHLLVSPVIAVIAAAIVMSNYGGSCMSERTKSAVSSYWEYAAFIANSLVFLLIGLQVIPGAFVRYYPAIAVGISALLISRAVVIYGLCPYLSRKTELIPMCWQHLLFWGALRGAVSMAMALSLPIGFPWRQEIIVASFGCVLFTLLGQGLTISPLIRLMNNSSAK